MAKWIKALVRSSDIPKECEFNTQWRQWQTNNEIIFKKILSHNVYIYIYIYIYIYKTSIFQEFYMWFKFNEKVFFLKPYFVSSVVTNCLLNILFYFSLFNFNERHSLKSFPSLINFKPYFVGPVVSKFLFILKNLFLNFFFIIDIPFILLFNKYFMVCQLSCCKILTSPSFVMAHVFQ